MTQNPMIAREDIVYIRKLKIIILTCGDSSRCGWFWGDT